METYGLIFMITVGVLYAVSIRLVTVQRYKELETLYRLGGVCEQEEIEDKYFIPFIIASLIVVGWFLIVKEPYQPFRDLTPSHSTSGWLWTIGAAWLMCIPFGLSLGSLGLLVEVKPEGTLTILAVVIFGVGATALLAVMLFKVYSPWLIWLGMGNTVLLTFLFKKWLPGEMDVDDSSSSSNSTPMSTSRSASSSRGYERNYPQAERRENRSVSSSSSSSSSSQSESESDRIAREARAQEYYDRYRDCVDKAERLLSESETCILSAEDNEYWARELNDSFKASAARSDRQRAERLRYESRRVRQEADRFYRLYEQHRR